MRPARRRRAPRPLPRRRPPFPPRPEPHATSLPPLLSPVTELSALNRAVLRGMMQRMFRADTAREIS